VAAEEGVERSPVAVLGRFDERAVLGLGGDGGRLVPRRQPAKAFTSAIWPV
jgi:hypothetical protein